MAAENETVSGEIQWWPVLLGAALVGAVAPWFVGGVDTDLRPTLRVLLGGGLLAVALSTQRPPAFSRVASAQYFLGVIVLDAAWYYQGTFNAPGFLTLFAIPVFAAALASRGWLGLAVAAFAVTGTTATAGLASQELRWYAAQLGLYPAGNAWRPTGLDALKLEVSGDVAMHLATLATFTLSLIGVALFGSAVSRVVGRLQHALRAAAQAQRESEALVARVLDQSGAPECLVSPFTGEVVRTNAAFDARFPAIGTRTLFGCLAPEYPEAIERLFLSAAGADAGSIACRPHGGFALLDVSVRPADAGEATSRLVQVRDTPPEAIAATALEEIGVGIAVVSPAGRVLTSNQQFVAAFPSAVVGADVHLALTGCSGLSGEWWNIAPRRKARLSAQRGSEQLYVTVQLLGANIDSACTALFLEVGHA
jgi:PAS domain-containing protein